VSVHITSGQVEHVRTVADFAPNAERLRATYDENFRNPQDLKAERFCWDYWHVPDQYTQLRTPADQYFAPEDYEELEAALLEYGKEALGCVGITPIWLSYYVGIRATTRSCDGCITECHAPVCLADALRLAVGLQSCAARPAEQRGVACLQTAVGRSCTATMCMGHGRLC
jgi:hypothetical protein